MCKFSLTQGLAVLVGWLLLMSAAPQASAQDIVDMTQIDIMPGSIAGVIQQGDRNQASIDQRAVASGAADLQNRALISQTGDDNEASITQEGSSNSADISQNGSDNEAAIVQRNVGSNAQLQQSGNGLGVRIEQFGAGAPGSTPISVTQSN